MTYHQPSLARRVINLSIPNSLQQLMRLLGAFFVTLMIARVGAEQLAGLALGYIFYLDILLFINGIFYGLSILVAKHFGASSDEPVSNLFGQIFWVGLILIIPAILAMRFSYSIFIFFGQNAQLAQQASLYLHGLSWGAWAMVYSVALTQFLLGLGRARILNFFSGVSLIVVTLSCYALIFGKWGLPKLGLAGAGYGLSFSATFNIVMVLIYIALQPLVSKYVHFKKIVRINFHLVKIIFKIGFPISINMLAELLAASAFVVIIGIVNHMALASYQVVTQIMYIPLMFPFAISQACAVVTSQALGEGKKDAVMPIARIGFIITLIPVGLFSLLFWIMPKPIVTLFLQQQHTDSTVLVNMAVQMLMITAFVQLIEAIRLIGIGSLRGMRDVKTPLFISLISYWLVNISIAAFIAFVLHAGVVWIWLGGSAGSIIAVILVLWRLRKQSAAVCLNS